MTYSLLVLAGSFVAHELAHYVEGRRRGYKMKFRIKRIDSFRGRTIAIGFEHPTRRPHLSEGQYRRDLLAIYGAGPLVNLPAIGLTYMYDPGLALALGLILTFYSLSDLLNLYFIARKK